MQLRLYARREPVLSFETSLNDLGFALDNSTITVRGIPHDDGSHVVVNFYHFFVSFVYFFCVGGFFVFYKKSGTHSADGKEEADFKVKIDNFFKRHHKVVPGAAIVATLSVLSELGIRFVRCITWTVYIIRDDSVHRAHDQGINGFIAVWLPQLWLILLVLTPNLIIHCIYFRIGCKQERCYAQNSKLCFCWMMFYNKVNVHIVLVSCLFSYLLIYASFPTFILIFAYPTRMIAVVTFVLAFLFSMTILFSILAHFYILAKPAEFRRQNFKKLAFYTIIFIFLALLLSTVIIVYFFGLLYVLLYVLVIGRASVVSNGPLAFLSLLPSAILSGLAWTAKRIFLNSDTEEPNKHPVRNQSPVDPPYPGNNWEVAKKDDIVPLAFPMHTRTSCPDMLEQLQQENVLKLRH